MAELTDSVAELTDSVAELMASVAEQVVAVVAETLVPELVLVVLLLAVAAWADACVALVLEFVACSQVADAVQTVAAKLLL